MTPQELRASILQLAIQGKLVEHYESETAVSVESSFCCDTTDFFEIPDNWKWLSIKDIASVNTGLSFKKQDQKDSGNGSLRVLRGGNIGDDYKYHLYEHDIYVDLNRFCSKFIQLLEGDIITPSVTSMEKICKTGFIEQDLTNVTAGGFVYIIRCLNRNVIEPKYLLYYISSSFNKGQCKPNIHKSGQTFYNLKKSGFVEQPICVPPLAEQKRIVGKIEELLPYVDRYEQAWSKFEEFNKKFPVDMQKSVLQMAIQGKLVEQHPEEGTGEELFKQIQAEKQELIKSGKIKKEKPLPEITEDEVSFYIPETWIITRFGNAITLFSGTDFKPEEYNNQQKGVPYITGASSLSDTGVLVNRWTETPRVFANHGDVLLVCKGSGYGKTVICDISEAHIARQIMAVKKTDLLDMNYIKYFLQANFNLIKSKGQGVIPGIDRSSVLNLVFPIPSLAEQKRIVAKLEEILPLCEKLK